jgi:hypothetical protein
MPLGPYVYNGGPLALFSISFLRSYYYYYNRGFQGGVNNSVYC